MAAATPGPRQRFPAPPFPAMRGTPSSMRRLVTPRSRIRHQPGPVTSRHSSRNGFLSRSRVLHARGSGPSMCSSELPASKLTRLQATRHHRISARRPRCVPARPAAQSTSRPSPTRLRASTSTSGSSHLQPLPRSDRPPLYRAYSTVDRKSTRLNSSHLVISYAVFCLKKKQSQPRLLAPAGASIGVKRRSPLFLHVRVIRRVFLGSTYMHGCSASSAPIEYVSCHDYI